MLIEKASWRSISNTLSQVFRFFGGHFKSRDFLKSKLIVKVEFLEEEGTGLGPTLEFFALVAAELQRSDLGMWLQVTFQFMLLPDSRFYLHVNSG